MAVTCTDWATRPARSQMSSAWSSAATAVGQLDRLGERRAGCVVFRFRDLEVVAQRQERPDRLAVVRAARQVDRLLEVLARLGRVADASEDAAEDAVRPGGCAGLTQS